MANTKFYMTNCDALTLTRKMSTLFQLVNPECITIFDIRYSRAQVSYKLKICVNSDLLIIQYIRR